MSGWDGDIGRMGRLADNIGRLARVPARASRVIAERITTIIQGEFAGGHDPYGKPWEPLAESTIDRHGNHPILDLSGKMRESLHVAPMRDAGVSITIDHPSEDHQTGWSGPQGEGPARPVLPGEHFPSEWKRVVDESVKADIEKTIRGR